MPPYEVGRLTIGDYVMCRAMVDRHLDELEAVQANAKAAAATTTR